MMCEDSENNKLIKTGTKNYTIVMFNEREEDEKDDNKRKMFPLVLVWCYVMQAVVSVRCLGDKCLSHANPMSTALTQLLIFRFSCLLTNKGIAQYIDNSN